MLKHVTLWIMYGLYMIVTLACAAIAITEYGKMSQEIFYGFIIIGSIACFITIYLGKTLYNWR